MGKLSTPDWIKEGFDSKEDWEKSQGKKSSGKKAGKTFKVKVCPKCGSDQVKVVLGGEEGKGDNGWECESCSWKGEKPKEMEMSEDEFMAYLDKMEGKNG